MDSKIYYSGPVIRTPEWVLFFLEPQPKPVFYVEAGADQLVDRVCNTDLTSSPFLWRFS